MSRAIPTIVRKGKTANSTSIYAQIKNGNIYKLKAIVASDAISSVIAKIEQAGKIQLKHWEGVRVKQPAWIKEDIEHASKMWEFEKSGDKAGAIAYLNARTASWEFEMQDEWQMTCGSPMWDELKAQEADHSGVSDLPFRQLCRRRWAS